MQQSLDSLSPTLIEYAQGYGVDLSEEQARMLIRHLSLVLQKNEYINLTRITQPNEALVLHIIDSVLFSTVMPWGFGDSFRLLDMGTGAGYPGIPLAILFSRARCDLADSVGKKCQAVSEFIDELGLTGRVNVICDRVESIAKTKGKSYDVVTARAMDKLSVLLEYASPLLCHKGILIASKGKLQNEEKSHALSVAPILGFELLKTQQLELPNGLGSREILCFKKVSQPKIHLPRAIGAAKHKPL